MKKNNKPDTLMQYTYFWMKVSVTIHNGVSTRENPSRGGGVGISTFGFHLLESIISKLATSEISLF